MYKRQGLNRSFSAQKWSWLPAQAWMDAADEAQDREFHGDYEIWGGDIDPDVYKRQGLDRSLRP